MAVRSCVDSGSTDGEAGRKRVQAVTSPSVSDVPRVEVESAQQAPALSGQRGTFSPAMRRLVTAADGGTPLRFAAPGLSEQLVLLRPRQLFAPGFRLSIGAQEASLSDFSPGIRVYAGRAFRGDDGQRPSFVSLAVVGSAMFLQMDAPDGSQLTVWGDDPSHANVKLATGPLMAKVECELVPDTGRAILRSTGEARLNAGSGRTNIDGPVAMGMLEPAPGVLELAGADPATGKLDRFVEPIPMAAQYALSLKDLLLLLVLDKAATGENTEANLAEKASQTLAHVSNVATIYENQLGLRLMLHEVIMIPNTREFADVPFADPLGDFRNWCQRHRRIGVYGWNCAMKQGAGLRAGGTVGLANVARIDQRDAVSVVQSDAGYLVMAHELAHNLGSAHTRGGRYERAGREQPSA